LEEFMNYRLTVPALAIAVFCSGAAMAQDQAASRAEVKKETRAAEKAGSLTPAGEGSPITSDVNVKSTLTRAQRMEDALSARRDHQLAAAGDGSSYKADAALRALPTTRSRADRKAETRLAAKNHELTPAGQGPGSPTK
jgi:hypothetical protein